MVPPVAALAADALEALPDHTQLPCEDGVPVNNDLEPPQSALLTDCLTPRFEALHPGNQYFIGEDVGIYFRYLPGQPLQGCRSPDWYYVPNVPHTLPGTISRRSYVLWNELISPFLVIEYVSGDGEEEHDQTPLTGKFWIYENVIRIPVYAIVDHLQGTLEVYQLVMGKYQLMQPNAAGRHPLPPLRLELGLWNGTFRNSLANWLRVWDADTGELIPHPGERAALAENAIDHHRELLADERELTRQQRERADAAVQRATRMAELGRKARRGQASPEELLELERLEEDLSG